MLEVRCGRYLKFFQNLFYELLSDITILHVDMFFLHVDMIYLVCRGSNVSSYKRIMSTWDIYILNCQALLFILNGAVVQSTEVVLCHLDRYCNVGEYQYFPCTSPQTLLEIRWKQERGSIFTVTKGITFVVQNLPYAWQMDD